MVMTDPIADLLTRIRNACMAEHKEVEINHSKMKEEVTSILKKEGFIADYTIKEITANKKSLVLFLRYGEKNESLISGLKRVSKPGRRIYKSYKDIPRVLNGYGVAIVSTSHGVLTDKDCRVNKVGGELLCYIW
ncbi:30S ribosomal protein S8 [bacterium]|nr:30S ribosomal protein S8 [bacterium]